VEYLILFTYYIIQTLKKNARLIKIIYLLFKIFMIKINKLYLQKEVVMELTLEKSLKILGINLLIVEQWGKKKFIHHFAQRAQAAILCLKCSKSNSAHKDLGEGIECSEDAFGKIFQAMKKVCKHFNWIFP